MRMSYVRLCLLILVACTTIGESGNPPDAAIINNRMEIQAKVMVKLFSGRENPTWSLTKEEIAAFNAILNELPVADPVKFKDGLGYQGFGVTVTNTKLRDTHNITIHKRNVRQQRGVEDKYLDDQSHKMERMLLESSKVHLEKQTYMILKNEIESNNLKN